VYRRRLPLVVVTPHQNIPDIDFAALKVCIIPGCKGAGTDSTLRWIDIIKEYFPCGSIVLADHLGGHMSEEVQEAFRDIGVHYFFFPQGVDGIMNPCDSAFNAELTRPYLRQPHGEITEMLTAIKNAWMQVFE
jgi:hypothetical protein